MRVETADLIENIGPRAVQELHNPRDCSVEVQTERPWHRTALYMMIAGRSHIDIAAQLGKTPQMVSILSRQRWFQELVARETSACGGDEVTALLRGAAKDCVLTLIEIRDSDAKAADRIASCKDLLDRHLGKATQRVEVEGKMSTEDPQAEMERVTKELEQLRKKETNQPN